MGILYHGSSISGIKRLEPRKSTHGTYVYATPYKELAIIFSGRCGDDMTYTLYREKENEPWKIVERIPNGFEAMYSNESSLYTLSDETFKDIHTGFSEVVSEVGVNTKSETHIISVYNAIKELANQGIVEIYRYPTRPKKIPVDDSDLIQKEINQCNRDNKPITKDSFKRVLYLHPNLLDNINRVLLKNNEEIYNVSDLVSIFEEYLVSQMLEPSREQYIKSAVISLSKYYPYLMKDIEEKLSILEKDKQEKINFILKTLEKQLPDFPKEFIEQAKKFYLKDERSYTEICNEINSQIKKIKEMEKLTSKNIPEEVLKNSILMIGPMGIGKSTISNLISSLLNIPIISLDDRQKLVTYYSKRKEFSNFKDFEFFLTSSVLTELKESTIIDFGAGHSIYENPIMFYEFKRLISKFANIVYMIPSKDKEESIKILNEKLTYRNPDERVLNDNKHFVNMHCNDEVATIKIYTKDKSSEDICREIITKVQGEKFNKSSSVDNYYKM